MKTPEELFTLSMMDVLKKCGSISKEVELSSTCRDQRIFMFAINWMRDELIANNAEAIVAERTRYQTVIAVLRKGLSYFENELGFPEAGETLTLAEELEKT